MRATIGGMAVLRHLLRKPIGLVSLCIVIVIIIFALFADWLVPYDPIALDIKARMQSPSAAHWLGTDQLGRDLLSRAIMGGRVALQVAIPAVFFAMFFGLSLGMIAAFGPRWLDSAIMIFLDTIRSFPTVMFALAVVALVSPSLTTVIFVVIVTSIPHYGRVARTQALSLRYSDYILAERSLGASLPRILIMHILPNIIGLLIILAAMDIPAVIALEAGLSFLGMGVKPPTPSWGALLKDGYAMVRNTPWPIIAGGVPIILATLGFTFLGETLRDIIDPRLRKEQ